MEAPAVVEEESVFGLNILTYEQLSIKLQMFDSSVLHDCPFPLANSSTAFVKLVVWDKKERAQRVHLHVQRRDVAII